MDTEKKPKRPRIGAATPVTGEGDGHYEKVNYPTDDLNRGNAEQRPQRNYGDRGYQQRPYGQNNRQGGYNNRQYGYQQPYQQRPNYQQSGDNNSDASSSQEGAETSAQNNSQEGFQANNYQQRQGYQPRPNYNQRQGGYNNRQGGYNNRQGGYNNNRQGGYNNRQGGYNQGYNQGGYNNQGYNQGGYNQGYNQGGYNNQGYNQGGYNQGYNQGGYNNNRQGGYNNNRQGGYNNNRQGGYNNNRQGGYNNQRQGGFNNRQGGYNNNQRGFNKNQRGFNKNNRFPQQPKQVEYTVEPLAPDAEMRLNKYMSNAGVCSRREADEKILAGVVTVNGTPVTELGFKIKGGDVVEYDGKVVVPERKCYVLLNKPKDCVTTTDDPGGRTTVLDIVKNACKERIYPVGRLDRNTTGVLLLTNDGDLASKLTHPKYVKKKIYHVWTDKPITEEDMQRLADGIELEDGEIHADEISYVNEADKNQAGIEIHSGKNRIVRRMFEFLGYRVVKLDRVYFAGLTKKNLPRGKWRYLSQEEVNYLRMGSFE
jgi:23S rRNA pseudouridine2605 synthase